MAGGGSSMRSPGGCIGSPIMVSGGSSMRSPGGCISSPGDLIDEPPPAMMGLPMQPPGDLMDNLMNMDLANLVDNDIYLVWALQCEPYRVEATWVELKKDYIDGFNNLVGSLDTGESAAEGAVRLRHKNRPLGYG
eukprot:5778857-Pyramimonas_sp.AAC.1